MEILYGKPAQSVRRFSRFKWLTTAVLLALLLLIWFTGSRPPIASKSVGQAPASLSIELARDGSLKVRGTVADEATRNQWLNAIRIGAQGKPVSNELRVGAVSPTPGWTPQLSSLVAVMRESRVAGLSFAEDKVLLEGTVASQGEKAEVEKMVAAQLPSGYRLDSRIAVEPSATASSRAPVPGSATSGARGSSAGSSSSGAGSSAGAGASGSSPGSAPSPATSGSGIDRPSASAGSSSPAGLDKAAAAGASGSEGQAPSKSAARKPANCPRQIRSLAKAVYFKTDTAILSSQDQTRLERLGECLGRTRVRIVGHADPRHTDEYNLALSERRARAVANALEQGGAPSSRITVVGVGSSKAAAKLNSREALQRSRRVDIQLR